MKIVAHTKRDPQVLGTQEIDVTKLSNLNQKSIRILEHLSERPMYAKELSRKTGIDEQIVYYYIRKLLSMDFIVVDRIRKINGVVAKVYRLKSESFFFKFGDFKKGMKIKEKEPKLFEGFIENRKLNSLIIVGSPDVIGAKKLRNRDIDIGIEFALFLGSYIDTSHGNKVRVDLSVKEHELASHNLIVIGGPLVNKVSGMLTKHLPVHINATKRDVTSKVSKKKYDEKDLGVICFIDNPFNPKKKLLYIAGTTHPGTRAAVVALKRKFSEIEKGNAYQKNGKKVYSKVVKGTFSIDGKPVKSRGAKKIGTEAVVDEVLFLE